MKMEKEMKICLATTWHPRGELPRFTRLLPLLEREYAWIVIVLLPGDDPTIEEKFASGEFSSHTKLALSVNEGRSSGRYMALKKAVETSAEFVHYVDMDRLLHWVETRPDEWKQALGEIERFDAIIFGRTQAALLSHPQALISTEMISNQVVSYLLQAEMDVSAGSKSFSRTAAQYLVEHSRTDHSIGSDAEWPILLKKAGFRLQYIPVDGLDWESADQYQSQAADHDVQSNAARVYDTDPVHWSHRVEIAAEIIQTALEVSRRVLPKEDLVGVKPVEFDYEAVFDVDDYLYFYSQALTDERTEAEVSALVKLLELDQPRKILDLACGFGRHTNRLAALGHHMTGVDITPGFLEIARKDAAQKSLDVRYLQGDMRSINFDSEFDCVLLLFTAFGYFSDEQNLQVLINMCNALSPGGLLLFDVQNRDTFLKGMRPFFVVEKEGNMMIDRMSFDSLQGRFYNHRVVYRDGIRKDKPHFIRLYNPNEIQSLITQAGLELHHLYGGWDAQELTADANRMVVIARKPA